MEALTFAVPYQLPDFVTPLRVWGAVTVVIGTKAR
jgi:hypothetical protein